MARGKRAEKPSSTTAETELTQQAAGQAEGSATAETAAETTTEAAAEPERRNSELTDDERLALLHHHKRKLQAEDAVIKEAKAEAASAKKRQKVIIATALKECGGEADDEIKDLIAAETPQGEAVLKSTIERHLRVLAWTGSPVGTQFSFDDLRKNTVDPYSEGKLVGIKGEPCNCPHDNSSPSHKPWMDGYYDGQGCLARGLEKIATPDVDDDDGSDDGAGDGDPVVDPNQIDIEESIAAAADMPGTPAPPIDSSDRPFGLPAEEKAPA